MLWRIIRSNFECKLHNRISVKAFPKHILQCNLYFSISSFLYIDGCIWFIINDCTTSLTVLFCRKITVIDERVLCEFFQNRGINSTDAYMHTIINYQEDFHTTHFSLSMFNTFAMVIADDTRLNFPTLLYVCPSLF